MINTPEKRVAYFLPKGPPCTTPADLLPQEAADRVCRVLGPRAVLEEGGAYRLAAGATCRAVALFASSARLRAAFCVCSLSCACCATRSALCCAACCAACLAAYCRE